MGNGKRRRRVAWLSSGSETHAFIVRQETCVCNGFSRTQVDADRRNRPLPRCRPCEIGLEQLW